MQVAASLSLGSERSLAAFHTDVRLGVPQGNGSTERFACSTRVVLGVVERWPSGVQTLARRLWGPRRGVLVASAGLVRTARRVVEPGPVAFAPPPGHRCGATGVEPPGEAQDDARPSKGRSG